MPNNNAGQPSDPSHPEIFLSPRVLDQAAFEEFRTQLQTLLHTADTAGTELASLLDKCRKTQSELKNNNDAHKTRLELGAKLLRTLETRSEELNKSLDSLEKHTDSFDALEHRITNLIDEKAREFESRIETAFNRAAERLHARTQERLDLLHATLERIKQEQAQLEHRQTSGTGTTPEDVQLLERLELSRAAAQQTSRELGQSLDGAMQLFSNLQVQRSDLESDLETTIQRAERALTQLNQAAADLMSATPPRATTPTQLPPELAQMADTFRNELLQDLAKMAAAMNMIANRAETMLRPASTPDGTPEIVIRMREQHDPATNT